MVARLGAKSGTKLFATTLLLLLVRGAFSDPAAGVAGDPDQTDRTSISALADEVVPRFLRETQVPGAAVAVVSHGRVVLAKGYGDASLHPRVPMTSRTGLYLGSTAKLFTAAAALQLADAGKLDLDVDVNRYLKDVRIENTYPGHPVTMRNLLTHTAGFDPDFGMVGTSANRAAGLPSLAEAVRDNQPDRIRPPGSVLAYDNYGVALAGLVVEDVSGVPYADYVNQRIFQPLKMSGTSAAQPPPARIAMSMATGYRPSHGGQSRTGAAFNPFTPAGPGQVSSADNMARFMVDQLSSHSRLGRDIPQLMQRSHRAQDPRIPQLGYIFEQRSRHGVRIVAKDGDTSGFHSVLYLLPEEKAGLFIAVNGDGNGKAEAADVLDELVDARWPGRAAKPPRAVADADAAAVSGRYQSSRVSHESVIKVRALTQSLVTVKTNADGSVTTSGRTLSSRSSVSRQRWVQIGPGLFQEADGDARLAFDRHGVLTGSQATNQVYLKIAWYQNPALHLGMALIGMAGLVVGMFTIPIAAGFRRLRGRPGQDAGSRSVRLIAWLTALLASVGAASFALLMANPAAAPEKLFLGSPELVIAMAALTLVVPFTAAFCTCVVVAWVRRWWRISGRLVYTLLAGCAVSVSLVAVTYNFVGPPFD